MKLLKQKITVLSVQSLNILNLQRQGRLNHKILELQTHIFYQSKAIM